jgi:cytochrome P450
MLPQFLEWEHGFMRGTTIEEQIAATKAIADYLTNFLEERSKQPPRDDVTSAILAGTIKGRPLTHGERIGMAMVLYLGGLDTVMSSLGWYMRYLANNQSLQKRLHENPGDIPGAVEDLLRAFGVSGLGRTVTRDTVFHGVPMKAGETILLASQVASRDPREFERPDVVDPDRRQRNMTMGTGIHNCLGIHLAKREIRVVLASFISRFRNIRIPDGAKVTWHTEGAVWGIDHLPLEIWQSLGLRSATPEARQGPSPSAISTTFADFPATKRPLTSFTPKRWNSLSGPNPSGSLAPGFRNIMPRRTVTSPPQWW